MVQPGTRNAEKRGNNWKEIKRERLGIFCVLTYIQRHNARRRRRQKNQKRGNKENIVSTILSTGLNHCNCFTFNSIKFWIPISSLKKFIFPSKSKLHGFSPQANYTDQATAACRRS
jgi:hypothetical protein